MTVTTSVNIGNTTMIFDQHMEKAEKRTSQYKLVVVAVDSEGKKAAIPEEVKKLLKDDIPKKVW